MKYGKKIRVVCAMSGGVDSAVSAAILVREGFEVIGAFMKFWADKPENNACLPQNRCCSEESEQRARKTALQLDIPFYVLDVRDEFKKLVVDRFIRGVKKGLTPNPCVVCNQEIKFGLLVKKALAMDAEFVATGHYCQIKKDKGGVFRLLRGADKNKDQSYFLWRLEQKQLSRIIFPVGCFEKNEVRQLAKKWKLPSALTAESQEVCFVNGDIDKFLEKYCGKKPGNIIDGAGNIIGRHNGLWFYTIGQRKGIGLSGGPFYVAKKDSRKNELLVGPSKEFAVKNVPLESVRWIGAQPELPLEIKTKIRYRSKEAKAKVVETAGKYKLKFLKPQYAVTPGQSAVFYRGRELLGGGIIKA
ncbi:MAG: tRNA 2-thiouridine(34) synthase MnmA [Candidatus Nealsonbacteria bacterium DGGOD1a]|nr:MAG: tRNA 2-thiouridine(34) synthase MnmA [Candidatus Nealsonbacteria bacterium DGGOD1a]